jgi:polysaccharide deacetylase family protein (PEP-CTERM system associated)
MLYAKDSATTPRTLHAMTIDVEDYFHVAALSKVVSPAQWPQQPSRVVHNTHKILQIFADKKINGTFFILGWVAERYPHLVKEIAELGHEIASHGYSHQLIYGQTPALFRAETERAKSILEDLSQAPIEGYRAASYSITDKSLWALDILAELGFTWDSSIFPIYHDNYGMPNTPNQPYRIQTRTGLALTEFPLTAARFSGLNIPVAGGGYFRQFPYALFKFLFNRASQGNRVPKVFYLHPWEVDPDQPRFHTASWFARFRHYTNLERCEGRLNRLIDDFDFGTLSDSLAFFNPIETYSPMAGVLIKQAQPLNYKEQL